MNVLQTLDALRQLGAGLRIDGGQLIVTASRGVIGADLAAAIRDNKPDLVKMLADPAAEAMAIYDAWQADPTNTSYAARYAEAANRAGLPFFDSNLQDLGAWGWDTWAAEIVSGASQRV